MQTQESVRVYTFHEDPGHGWLEVPMEDLRELGVVGKITSCSYRKGDTAYLEEDLDCSTFAKAAKAAGWTIKPQWVHEDPTPIRGYRMFYR